MTSEIQKMKTYKLQKKNLIETGKHYLLSTVLQALVLISVQIIARQLCRAASSFI